VPCCFLAQADIGAGDDDGLVFEGVGGIGWGDEELGVEEAHFEGYAFDSGDVLWSGFEQLQGDLRYVEYLYFNRLSFSALTVYGVNSRDQRFTAHGYSVKSAIRIMRRAPKYVVVH
jgi:hypothetical protein